MQAGGTSMYLQRTITSTLAVTKMACWKTSSAATWWRSAQPVYLRTSHLNSTTRASGTCRRLLRSVYTVAWVAIRFQASAMERYAAYATDTTSISMDIFYVTAAAMDTSLLTC